MGNAGAAVIRLRAVLVAALLLMMLNYWSHKGQQQSFSGVHQELGFLDSDKSDSPNQYSILNHVCFQGKPLSRVNNKQGGHEACFAACLAHNEMGLDVQCGGWSIRTLLKKRRPFKKREWNHPSTCFLYQVSAVSSTYDAISCTSAVIHRKASLMQEREVDDYDDPDFYLSEEEIAEYYYQYKEEAIDGSFSSVGTFKSALEMSCPGNSSRFRPKRLYISCLQASGCSLFGYVLAQKYGSVAVLDAGVRQHMPLTNYFLHAHNAFPEVSAIIFRQSLRAASAASLKRLEDIVEERFQPDLSFLFLRHPVDNFISLVHHLGQGTSHEPSEEQFKDCEQKNFESLSFGLRCGTPRAKLRTVNEAFKRTPSDRLVLYEEICSYEGRVSLADRLNTLGYCIDVELMHWPKRTIVEVLEKSLEVMPSGQAEEDALFWGAGDLNNTFHDQKNWTRMPREKVFIECPSQDGRLPSEEKRLSMLKSASKPYDKFTLTEIHALVKEEAPELLAYYDSKFN